MNIFYADLETFGHRPITHGTHAYAEASEIMVAAGAMNDGPVEVRDLTLDYAGGMAWLQDQIAQADITVWHNSHFDRTVLKHHGVDLPAEKVRDTMVTAMAHSLPGSLGQICDILQIPIDQAKNKEGKRLIQLLCKERPKKQKLRRATRETHPKEWAEFLDYARLDIEAVRAIDKKLPKWNLTPAERELWLLDQKINDRGVAIDMELVHSAMAAVELAQVGLAEDAHRLTDGQVHAATQRDAMIRFILEQFEIPMEDLRASTVEAMLENGNYPAELRELLQVRLQASTTSTAKYKALDRSVSSDGRLRGALQFCGAIRTGRWSGRLFQPQNLTRPTLKQEMIELGIDAMKAGCAEYIFENVMELASSSIRGAIVAPPAKKLVIADLSNIEGRVLAWLAGETWKLKAFAEFDQGIGADLYKLAYARSFRVDAGDVTKDQRQIGKVQELAMGYEGGVGAFITFALAYGIDLDELADRARPALGAGLIAEAEDAWDWFTKMKRSTAGLSRETWVVIDAIKRAWRYAHPATSAMWKDLANAARDAISNPGRVAFCGKLQLVKRSAWLLIRLPSGRCLCYPAAQVDETGQISYMGINQYSRKWQRLKTYGGKLVENVTQAVARDVMAFGMFEAEQTGYQVALSVHDELITETLDHERFTAEQLASIMSHNPSWAEGLPLAAAGFETYRYRKD
ncbi:DNA-directed DNA polymerase, family A, palm domain containing protein [uncultured Caudovirales phage]|uniref:DNA-directed DNA polymerase, family A, palm domain containing protein n=1 Tax=uncultured Caudovirales phage TaxID=2100421 RepID=A0A6J7VQC3_9CAUD|nr:DNA-directed DNA polymerase, family A, palm domain containing protein [uncultured Caudovirales phage]